MADHYYSSMSSGSVITHVNWNEMIGEIYTKGGISGSYVGHSGNTSTAHGLATYTGNTSLITLGNVTTGTWQGTAVDSPYLVLASGSEYHSAYLSAQALKKHSFHTLISGSYLQSGTEYSKAYMSAQIASYESSGFDATLYMTSTNSLINFQDSSTALSKYYPSTLGKNLMDYSSNAKTLYPGSSTAISRYADSSSIQTKFLHSGVTLNAVSANTLATSDYIRHIGDNNTNFRFDGDDSILISVSGAEIINIGYDTTYDKFITIFNQDDDSNYEFIVDDQNGYALYMHASTGNIGIGGLSEENPPVYKLQVVGAISAQAFSGSIYNKAIENASDTTLTSPASGEVLVYKADNSRWENELPPITYTVANIKLLSGQNINMGRYSSNESTYIWQANACNSGGASVSGLSVELLRNDVSVYKTSSAILQKGYPLAKAEPGDIEIRFMYSGAAAAGSNTLNGSQYGTAMMQVSIY